ncbi:unnamed protein product [Lymnaea stagnalis]|uniref:Uncharacterized protein n=1 Tax=Lymnaea stagnalis TaxID=6523 RepID=A0AAV2I916_LYMST
MLLLVVATVLTTLFSISSETPLLDLSEDKTNAVLSDMGERPDLHLNSPISLGLDEAFEARENLATDNSPRTGGRFHLRALDRDLWKRACRFNLGGHCLTEEMNRAAEIYYYLKSPYSPGRRRRSAVRRSSRGYLLR